MFVEGLPYFIALATILFVLSVRPLVERFYIPFSLFLILIGYLVSELMVAAGLDTGIRYHNFQRISHDLLLPMLIFYSAFNIKLAHLLEEKYILLLITLPALLIALVITAVFIYYGIGHPSGFPWIAAFITAAILTATSPRSVIEYLQSLPIPKRLNTILEVEGLVNGMIAIVLFQFFLAWALPSEMSHSLITVVFHLAWKVGGGLIIGSLLGMLIVKLFHFYSHTVLEAAIVLITIYFLSMLANTYLHTSAAVAIFTFGLYLGHQSKENFDANLWDLCTLFAMTALFLLVGVTVTLPMFTHRWLAMLIGIIGTLLARGVAIFLSLSPTLWFGRRSRLHWREQTFLSWGGMRGAICIALAFSVPTSLPYWWTIQSIVFGVVLFTILIQASLMPVVCQLLQNQTDLNRES